MFAYLVPKSIGNVGNFVGFYENKEVTQEHIMHAQFQSCTEVCL